MATISLSKTMVILPYAGGNQTVNITVVGSTLSSYSVTGGGSLIITRNASSFTVQIGQNPEANSERLFTPIVTVNAEDGTTEEIQMYVFQKTQNITIVDSAREKTLNSNESTVYYFFPSERTYTGASYTKVMGDITVTNFRYELDEYGCASYFTTANNETNEVQNAVLAVSCNDGSSNDTAYVLLHKNGTPGSIAIAPKDITVYGSTTTRTFTVTSNQINSSSFSYNAWGDIDFGSVAYNNDHTQITATWSENNTGASRVGYLSVIGQDIYGYTKTDYATITQLAKPSISFVNSGATVQASDTSYDALFVASSCSNLTVSDSGTVGITSTQITTVGGDQVVRISFSANQDSSNKQSIITLTGTGNDGFTYSDTFTLIQSGFVPAESSLEFGDKIRILSPTEVSAYYFIRTTNISSVTVSFSGNVNITNHTLTATENGYELFVFTADNTSTAMLETTITATGTTLQGITLTDTATLRKKGVAGSISLNPNNVSVSSSAGNTSSVVTAAGIVTALTVDYWGSGGVTTVTNASISGSTLTVAYGANSTANTVTNYVRVRGTDSYGDVQSATLVITQAGASPSASITITPSTQTVRSNEVYAAFNITTSGTVNNLMMTTTDFWITDYMIENGVLSVTFGTNRIASPRTATLTVSGTDSGGNEVSATATLVQEGAGWVGSITINPDSRTLQATEATCMYVVTCQNINRITSVEKSGNVVTTDYHLEEEDFGYYLWVTTADNTGTTDLTSTFTIIGVDAGSNTVRASATLIKKAPVAGSITIEPWQRTVGYQAGSTTFTVTARNIVGNLTLELNTTSTMNITSYTLNNGTLTVAYGANSGTQKNGAINIRGTDTNGVVITEIARLYQDQAPATYTFAFNPASQSARTVTVSPTSLRYTIDSWKNVGSQYELGYTITRIEYTGGSWPTIINIAYEDGKPYILIPMNLTGDQRTAVIHFVQEESDLEILSTVTQLGRGSSTETFLPIWRDDIHTTSADSFIEYHISLGSDIIYAGKAYKYPEESDIEWTINDVCSNYIGTGITFTGGIQKIPDYCKVFSTVTNDQTLTNTRFYNSWAYEDTDYWLSDPIDYRVDPRQWLPVSFLSSNSRDITVGSTNYRATADDDGWTVMTNLNNLTLDCGSAFTVTPGIGQARNYRIDCGDFVLYYANSYGGWDALLVKGTTKKTDNIEHMNYRRKSRDLSDFSKVNYQNNITPTWSLNTGITVNGKKMYHLLESVMVYLHNLETNEIIPVVITNAQCEYLDYTNNGKKPYYYNITVEESNLKLRK